LAHEVGNALNLALRRPEQKTYSHSDPVLVHDSGPSPSVHIACDTKVYHSRPHFAGVAPLPTFRLLLSLSTDDRCMITIVCPLHVDWSGHVSKNYQA
jgi:hypothetical protein